MLNNKHSFRLIKSNTLKEKENSVVNKQQSDFSTSDTLVADTPIVSDQNKRIFLKALGIAGVGIAASQLLPKKAEA